VCPVVDSTFSAWLLSFRFQLLGINITTFYDTQKIKLKRKLKNGDSRTYRRYIYAERREGLRNCPPGGILTCVNTWVSSCIIEGCCLHCTGLAIPRFQAGITGCSSLKPRAIQLWKSCLPRNIYLTPINRGGVLQITKASDSHLKPRCLVASSCIIERCCLIRPDWMTFSIFRARMNWQ
jgi:hypothetical protein